MTTKPRPLQDYTLEELKLKLGNREISLEEYYSELKHRGVKHA